MILLTHRRGNPTKLDWLVKAADRLAAERQRLSVEHTFEINPLNAANKRKFVLQLKQHFALSGLSVQKLKQFINDSKILDLVLSDNFDANHTTLRQHLLLTEAILSVLIKLPMPKHLDKWIETKTVQKIISTIKLPERTNITQTNPKLEMSQNVRKVLVWCVKQKWQVDKIALKLGIPIDEVIELVSELSL